MSELNDNKIFGMSYEEFIDADVFEKLGIGNAPSSQKDEVIKKISDTIFNRTMIKIDDLLVNDEKRNEFKSVLEEGNNEKIGQFLQSAGIDVKQIILQEAVIYKAELLALAKI